MSGGYGTPRYRWYVLGVLTLAYTVSFIDRSLLSLLVQPIQADLGISDTQISLVIGLAFAVFYTFMGIPIAYWADRRSRRGLIAVGIAAWSVMTAACGLARSFGQLFVARVGVGVRRGSANARGQFLDHLTTSRVTSSGARWPSTQWA